VKHISGAHCKVSSWPLGISQMGLGVKELNIKPKGGLGKMQRLVF
jgi:hypothetical protein